MNNNPFTRPQFWLVVLTPDWDAALEAVVSALARIHWLTRSDALALMQAYSAAVAAYGAWPQHKQTALQYLAKSKQILDRAPGGSALARKANKLIENRELTREDLRGFVDDLENHVRDRREAEAAAYRRSVAERRWTGTGPCRSGPASGGGTDPA